MEAIIGIAFLLSGYNNGAEFTVGAGFAENDQVFINPVGIVRVITPVYQEKNWQIALKASHLSSIPDAEDNWNGSDLNMASIEFTVKIGGRP